MDTHFLIHFTCRGIGAKKTRKLEESVGEYEVFLSDHEQIIEEACIMGKSYHSCCCFWKQVESGY